MIIGKELARIVHKEELTINQIFLSLFVLFTQADAIQKNKLAAAIIWLSSPAPLLCLIWGQQWILQLFLLSCPFENSLLLPSFSSASSAYSLAAINAYCSPSPSPLCQIIRLLNFLTSLIKIFLLLKQTNETEHNNEQCETLLSQGIIKMSGGNYHAKLNEADDSPDNFSIEPILPDPVPKFFKHRTTWRSQKE